MKSRKLSVVRAVLRVTPLLFKHSPFLIFLYTILTLSVAVISGLTIYCNQFFYDSLIDSVYGNTGIARAAIGAGAVVFMMLAVQVLGKINGCVWVHLGDKMEYDLIFEYNKKISKVSAVSFENPEFLEDLSKAGDGIYGVIGMFATICEIALYFCGFFLVTGIYLWKVSPILLFVLFLIFIPTAISLKLQSRMYAEEADEVTSLRRKANSYSNAATNMRETRMFGAFEYFYKLVYETQTEIFKITRRTEQKNCRMQLILNATKMIGWLSIALLMVAELISGNITVGIFAAVYSSIGEMFHTCEDMLKRIKGDISENLGMIEDYIEFLDKPSDRQEKAVIDFNKCVEVENISFTYPAAAQKAIDHVSFKIGCGETVAIVGENGSGKSTLAKLLCGLYIPDEGYVHIGGADSSTVAEDALYSKTSAVFQNYMRYHTMSLKENVLISDFQNGNDPEDFMRIVGFPDISKLPGGYDTVMSREFDGAELSGGQWQRVAIARGLYRLNEFIILDEPTAAIDPLEESRIYRMFASIAKDRTCVLITHRLGSAKIADRIIVMDGGHITEIGTHDELIRKNGQYADMWAAATERYR